MGREEALRMACRLEAPHDPLPLARRLVGVFRPVIEVPVLPMLHARQYFPLGRAIAFELVRDDHPRNIPAALEQLTEEFLGGVLVPPTLDQDIQHMTVLIHRPPQVVTLLIDGEEDLIKVPLLARSGMSATQRIGIGLAKFAAPIPLSFVPQGNATFCHQLFDTAIAEGKTVIQPHAVADDLCRESMTFVWIGGR